MSNSTAVTTTQTNNAAGCLSDDASNTLKCVLLKCGFKAQVFVANINIMTTGVNLHDTRQTFRGTKSNRRGIWHQERKIPFNISRLVYRDASSKGKGWWAYLADTHNFLIRLQDCQQPNGLEMMSVLHGQAQDLGRLFYVPNQPLIIHPDKKVALSSEPEGQFADDVPYGTAENPIFLLEAQGPAQRVRETTIPRQVKDAKLAQGTFLYSSEHALDIGEVPGHLPALSQVEEMLIVRFHVHVQIFQHRGQQYKYSGRLIDFSRDTGSGYSQLPLYVRDLDIIVLRPVIETTQPHMSRQFKEKFPFRQDANRNRHRSSV
ncbi:hypothetical protein HDV62DRAFT_397316 [Trichoderma sp. SZMC 28011]